MKPSVLRMENFASIMYKLRTRHNEFVSQSKLATLSGYTQTYISLIEKRRVNPSSRCKKDLLRALGINSSDLSKF